MGYLINLCNKMIGRGDWEAKDAKHHSEVAVRIFIPPTMLPYLEEYFFELLKETGSKAAAAQMVVEVIIFELAQQNQSNWIDKEKHDKWLHAIDEFCDKHNIPKIHRSKPKPKEARPSSITITIPAPEDKELKMKDYEGPPEDDRGFWI